MNASPKEMLRFSIGVSGVVHGVGFRPFVYSLALRFGLSGFVRNDACGVSIEVEGSKANIEAFLRALESDTPRQARLQAIRSEPLAIRGDLEFRIKSSASGPGKYVPIPPDIATCDDCLAELFDPTNRRYMHPFISCTACGPRLTMVLGLPFDRERTTFGAFPLCGECQSEYSDPKSRRFHAQSISCLACGPELSFLIPHGGTTGGDPIALAADRIRLGQVVAIKGIGGFHLVCDGTNEEAILRLRQRKRRDRKPFALLVQDIPSAEGLAEISREEQELLTSFRRPIVLLRRRQDARISESVAVRNRYLGVMLPSTAVHHLLMRELGGRTLVMTSGNASDEPIACEDTDALSRLRGIADAFLVHNLSIAVRCDDSVAAAMSGRGTVLRRSRGVVPEAIELPVECRGNILALGGHLKNTFALGWGKMATLSHHLGDLSSYRGAKAFGDAIASYERTFSFRPDVLVCDYHPDYASTHYATRRAMDGIRLVRVQHHHAHLASCLVDNGLSETVLGVIFDGTGFGLDGTIWGGEFLLGDCREFRRVAHLRAVPLPGGERAVREPWRMAVSYLSDAKLDSAQLLSPRVGIAAISTVERMIEQRLNCPGTSSAGRLFDAVASLLGVCDRATYEAQAAIELEWHVRAPAVEDSYSFELLEEGGVIIVDTRPTIREIVMALKEGAPIDAIAARFHGTMAHAIVAVAARIREATGVNAVALSGGVFTNATLLEGTLDLLTRARFRAYSHRQVPSNDGGLSLGQLAVAAAQLEDARS